ncbi:MAG: aminotransferase class IV [Balneolaceae bacterium]|nr:aminotransferase class IV [Balneolaceae bacterium]MCH8548598.1 aminotransferase class IV [Balneolaceae bacterium]
MKRTAEWVSFNGEFTPSDEVMISPLSSSIYYGTGCFETLVAENLRFFRFDEHVKRLNAGIQYLTRSANHARNSERLQDEVTRLIHHNKFSDKLVRVRIQVIIEESGGYGIPDVSSVKTLITLHPVSGTLKPLRLDLVPTRVIPSECRPVHLKLSNMLHYRQAYREAQQLGADDALMLTTSGKVAETSIANIFWKTGDQIHTPAKSCDLLPGITRNALIDCLNKEMDITVREGEYEVNDLESADLVWITNSVKGIQVIESLGEKELNRDLEFESRLIDTFQEFKARQFKK